MPPIRTRQTAEERRQQVLEAAAKEFAVGGYAAATTQGIADRAGISQAYVFRLFGSKRELFMASLERCYARVEAVMRERADACPSHVADERLAAMGEGYRALLEDREQLVLQMHGYAASIDDPEIRAVSQRCYLALWQAVVAMSGAAELEVQQFFAQGMLMNVAAALDLPVLCQPLLAPPIP